MSASNFAEAANPADGLLAALATPIARWTVADAEHALSDRFGLSGTATELGGERNQNFHVVTSEGDFLLKIAGLLETRDILDFENRALMHVAAVDPSLPVPRVRSTLAGAAVGRSGAGHDIRLMSFVPGVTLANHGSSAALRHDVGRCCARLARALRGFFDPAANRQLIWDMRQVAALAALSGHLPAAQRAAVEPVFDRFARVVLPALGALRAQVIHNDLNARNLLVDPASPDVLSGVVDFGDIVHAPLIIDLAVAAAHQMRDEPHPLRAASDVVAGFAGVLPIEDEEVALLPDLIVMRLAMGIAIRGWRSKANPADSNYHPHSNEQAMASLRTLGEVGRAAAVEAFRAAAGLPAPAPAVDAPALALRRRNVLGPGLRQFYDVPFYPVRGRGVWLYDAAGTEYLDAYNNVAHVGHCHPYVGAAMARQAATVNTNTRYLHHAAVAYAERLAATMPVGLDMCVFTCTGTEANDLAWRLATAATGNNGVLATRHAYHGNSTFVSALDGSMATNDALAWVARVDPPDARRHDVASYAASFDAGVDRLQAGGHAPAAVFLDTTFASDGLHLPPAGFMDPALARLRQAGGLVVADEVQPGFGRLGTHMWGFQKFGFVPDIVTIGKPAGNGHPIGIVLTSRAILEAFFKGNRYFNTFGGNPVSCATGLAVLDVVEREGLQENALSVGAYLLDGLSALAAIHGCIGGVRGSGLFIGVDVVDGRGEPAPAEARRIMNEMARRGVLIGVTGPTKSMLKIRPPMVFGRIHADRLVGTLDGVLAAGGPA